jgi:hypothetical protein
VVSAGDVVKVKVLEIDLDRRRVALSRKQCLGPGRFMPDEGDRPSPPGGRPGLASGFFIEASFGAFPSQFRIGSRAMSGPLEVHFRNDVKVPCARRERFL